MQARVAFCAGQIIDGVADFDRVAGGAGQRFVHVGDERDGRQAGVGGDRRNAGRELARAFSVGMKAPEPVFTSMTRPCSPAASFFDRIEAVMSATNSTVAVTSRIA